MSYGGGRSKRRHDDYEGESWNYENEVESHPVENYEASRAEPYCEREESEHYHRNSEPEHYYEKEAYYEEERPYEKRPRLEKYEEYRSREPVSQDHYMYEERSEPYPLKRRAPMSERVSGHSRERIINRGASRSTLEPKRVGLNIKGVAVMLRHKIGHDSLYSFSDPVRVYNMLGRYGQVLWAKRKVDGSGLLIRFREVLAADALFNDTSFLSKFGLSLHYFSDLLRDGLESQSSEFTLVMRPTVDGPISAVSEGPKDSFWSEIECRRMLYVGTVERKKSFLLSINTMKKAFEHHEGIQRVCLAKDRLFAGVIFKDSKSAKDALEKMVWKPFPFKPDGPEMRIRLFQHKWEFLLDKVFMEEIKFVKQIKQSAMCPKVPAEKAANALNLKGLRKDGPLVNVPLAKDNNSKVEKVEEKTVWKIKRMYCCVCERSDFLSARIYERHLTLQRHRNYLKMRSLQNEARRNLLRVSADLADKIAEDKVKFKPNPYSHLPEKTSERIAYENNFYKDTKCEACKFSTNFDEEYVSHVCSLSHLQKCESFIELRDESSEYTEENFEDVEKELLDAKKIAVLCPISLDNPPVYDKNECFGLEFFERKKEFTCVPCNTSFGVNKVHSHSKYLGHFMAVMECLKKTNMMNCEDETNNGDISQLVENDDDDKKEKKTKEISEEKVKEKVKSDESNGGGSADMTDLEKCFYEEVDMEDELEGEWTRDFKLEGDKEDENDDDNLEKVGEELEHLFEEDLYNPFESDDDDDEYNIGTMVEQDDTLKEEDENSGSDVEMTCTNEKANVSNAETKWEKKVVTPLSTEKKVIPVKKLVESTVKNVVQPVDRNSSLDKKANIASVKMKVVISSTQKKLEKSDDKSPSTNKKIIRVSTEEKESSSEDESAIKKIAVKPASSVSSVVKKNICVGGATSQKVKLIKYIDNALSAKKKVIRGVASSSLKKGVILPEKVEASNTSEENSRERKANTILKIESGDISAEIKILPSKRIALKKAATVKLKRSRNFSETENNISKCNENLDDSVTDREINAEEKSDSLVDENELNISDGENVDNTDEEDAIREEIDEGEEDWQHFEKEESTVDDEQPDEDEEMSSSDASPSFKREPRLTGNLQVKGQSVTSKMEKMLESVDDDSPSTKRRRPGRISYRERETVNNEDTNDLKELTKEQPIDEDEMKNKDNDGDVEEPELKEAKTPIDKRKRRTSRQVAASTPARVSSRKRN